MINALLVVLAYLVIAVQGVFAAFPFIAPDFQPSGPSPTVASYVFAGIFLIFSPLFFSLTYIRTKKLLSYLFQTMRASLGSLVLPVVALFLLSLRLNFFRCKITGFCTGGEPFDFMSTIFLGISSTTFLVAFLVVAPLLALGVHVLNKALSKNMKPTKKNPMLISFDMRVIFLVGVIILLIFQYLTLVKHYAYHSAVQDVITEAMLEEQCFPYEHCGDEKMDIHALINSAKTTEVPSQLSHEQTWAVSLGSMIAQMNYWQLGKLSLVHPSAPDAVRNGIKIALHDSWDIDDKPSTLKVLDWLANEGHSLDQYALYRALIRANPDFNETQLLDFVMRSEPSEGKEPATFTEAEKDAQLAAFRFVKNNEAKTGDNLIYAWDYGRFVSVAQEAYTVGYLSEAEALVLIEEVGKRVRTRFHSWKEFGDNYMVGRLWWAQSRPGLLQETQQLYAILMRPSGQWGKTPWEWSE